MSETVLVVGVGAVAGIGAAVARKFAGAGYHVVVSGRTREKLETVVLQIQETVGWPITSSVMSPPTRIKRDLLPLSKIVMSRWLR